MPRYPSFSRTKQQLANVYMLRPFVHAVKTIAWSTFDATTGYDVLGSTTVELIKVTEWLLCGKRFILLYGATTNSYVKSKKTVGKKTEKIRQNT